MMGYWWPNMMGGFGPWGMGGALGWILMVLFWVLAALLVVYLVRGLVRTGGSVNHPEKTPLDILKERYAKGEINKEEFEQKKKDLS